VAQAEEMARKVLGFSTAAEIENFIVNPTNNSSKY